MRAIIVDDEPIMIRYFFRESRSFPELAIQEAFTSAFDALEYVRSNPVDIAFLDIKMPEISGIELASQLRGLCPDIRIVYTSAIECEIDVSEARGDYYLLKPYGEESLRLMLDHFRQSSP